MKETDNLNIGTIAINELFDGLVPYPENIFVEEQQWLNNHILPLLSIDLGILRTELRGTIVYMVSPLEPFDGLIGENTTAFHNEFVGTNWLAFKLTDDNKYQFLADEQYFYFAPQYERELHQDEKLYLNEQKNSYRLLKNRYIDTGKLIQDLEYPNEYTNFLDQLGGRVWNGNWLYSAPIPPSFEVIEPDEEANELINLYMDLDEINYRLSDDYFIKRKPRYVIEKEKQRKIETLEAIKILQKELSQLGEFNDSYVIKYKNESFIYVGNVAGYNYADTGADSILMFYEPTNKIVLFTYDWT